MNRWLRCLGVSVWFILLISTPLAHAQSPVPNDSAVNTIHITPPFEHRQDTSLATSSGDDPAARSTCFNPSRSAFDHTVWYRYTPTQAGTLQLSTIGTQYSHMIAVFSIFTSFGFDHMGCSTNGTLNLAVIPNRDYYVMIAAIGADPVGGALVFRANFVLQPAVLTLMLVNADTNTDIMPLPTGSPYYPIDLGILPTRNLNIRAVTTDNTASIRWELDGNPWYRIESYAPFVMAGDHGGDYLPWDYTVTQHTITAVPYGQINASGPPGTSLTVEFSFIYSAEPERFVLVNADTDQDIMQLDRGDVIDLSDLPTRNLNIRVEFDNNLYVGSVEFVLKTDTTRFVVENGAPYSLGGDNSGNYRALRLPPNEYHLAATPYLRPYAQGASGTSDFIYFSVVE